MEIRIVFKIKIKAKVKGWLDKQNIIPAVIIINNSFVIQRIV